MKPTVSVICLITVSRSVHRCIKGALLEVRITKDKAEFTLLEGGEISFTVRGKEVVLKSGETYTYLLS